MALFIKVIKAKALENVDGSHGISDPYVQIRNPNDSKWVRQTKRVDNDLNPVFNDEPFRMEVSSSPLTRYHSTDPKFAGR
jgi:Ca2+-dependent lipid-binding protein